METITGTQAIQRMRGLRINGPAFSMWHITFNRKTQQTNGMRHVKHCRLRPSLPCEKFAVSADLYLPYIDHALPTKEQNRVCRKKLIRYVAFPPTFEKMKVNWFTS